MNAIILAGGKGSRLAPLTNDTPKPMLPIANRPMLDFVTSQLLYFGIDDIVYAIACKKEQIKSRLASYDSVKYKISCDDEPLGTAGSVKKAEKFLHENFVVMSGDCLNNVNLDDMINKHLSSDNLVTVAVVSREDTRKYGVVQVDEEDKIIGFVEKPQTNDYGELVSIGIYIINKALLQQIPSGVVDFARDVFPILVQNRQIGVYFHDGFWTDIGAIEDYYYANFFMLNTEFYPFIKTKNEDENDKLKPFALDCVIIGECNDSIVGKGATVEIKSKIKNCIIMPQVIVRGEYENCIIGHDYIVRVEQNYNFLKYSTNYNNLFANILP